VVEIDPIESHCSIFRSDGATAPDIDSLTGNIRWTRTLPAMARMTQVGCFLQERPFSP
jgi:hypothetical protein